MTSTTRIRTILLIAILLFAGIFRLVLLDSPFVRNTEGCAAFFAQLARNYFRYDFSQSYGIPVMSMGKDAAIVFYANHPPTTAMLIAIVNGMTGYRGGFDRLPSDWQARLPTALFTLGCIVTIYILLKNRGRPRAGLIAAMLFASIPMTLTYGGFPDVISPQLVLMAMLTVAAYERFHGKPSGKSLALLVITFFGAAIMDWPAFHLVPVLCLHFVITRKPKQWPWIVGFGVITVILFGGLYAYLTLGQTSWGWMASQFSRRGISSAGDSAHHFGLGDWMKQAIWAYAIGRHTAIVTALALAWVVMSGVRKFSDRADRLTGLLLAWALVHVMLGRQGVYQHEWWWWPLTPGLVIAAGLATDQIVSRFENSPASESPNRATNIALTLALIVFASCYIPAAVNEQLHVKRMHNPPLDYTTQELGEFIRKQVSPDACAFIAESDISLPFWHYTDRGVRREVWGLEDFRKRSEENFVDLPFTLTQPRNGPFAAMIIPKAYLKSIQPSFVDYLDSHYRRQEDEKFIAWNLQVGLAGMQF